MIEDEINIEIVLNQLANVISEWITGKQITKYLRMAKLPDSKGEGYTKCDRLYDSFINEITVNRSYNNIGNFIEIICNPVNYIGERDKFAAHKNIINNILIIIGLEIDDSGKIIQVQPENNFDAISLRVNKLKEELDRRRIHKDLLLYCSKEYLSNNYFHAVFEAIKGTLSRIRELTGSPLDGQKLIDWVFNKERPKLKINEMQSCSDFNEFEGLKHLLLFLHKSIRDLEAHELRIDRDIDFEKALDIFVCISLANKYLDTASTFMPIC